MSKQHILSLYAVNKPGVLMRIFQIFARRGYNVDSIVASPEMDGKYSRVTIAAQGDSSNVDQIVQQLAKLVDVVHCEEHTGGRSIIKEMALIKVLLAPETRAELLQIVEHFKGKTVDLTPSSLIIQVDGDTDKIDAMIGLLRQHQIVELVRSGKMLMARGETKT
ncbi:MAG: acetolactate synthase small subunit [Verrucomicrobiota bacterium]|jgi:acetolactate synthase-1/3 small subunit